MREVGSRRHSATTAALRANNERLDHRIRELERQRVLDLQSQRTDGVVHGSTNSPRNETQNQPTDSERVLIDSVTVDLDELDDANFLPLRRMHGRLFRTRTLRSPPPAAPVPEVNGLGDRERSWSPTPDHWETHLTTIEPTPTTIEPSNLEIQPPRVPRLAGPSVDTPTAFPPTAEILTTQAQEAAQGVSRAIETLRHRASQSRVRANDELVTLQDRLNAMVETESKLEHLERHFNWLLSELESLRNGTSGRDEVQAFALRRHALPVLRGIVTELEEMGSGMESLYAGEDAGDDAGVDDSDGNGEQDMDIESEQDEEEEEEEEEDEANDGEAAHRLNTSLAHLPEDPTIHADGSGRNRDAGSVQTTISSTSSGGTPNRAHIEPMGRQPSNAERTFPSSAHRLMFNLVSYISAQHEDLRDRICTVELRFKRLERELRHDTTALARVQAALEQMRQARERADVVSYSLECILNGFDDLSLPQGIARCSDLMGEQMRLEARLHDLEKEQWEMRREIGEAMFSGLVAGDVSRVVDGEN